MTTGRPRRCGWFDAVIARYAARVNGITDFFLTKLDVLSGLEKVPICVAYEIDGRARRRHADDPERLPPRRPGVRGDAGLVRGPLAVPDRSTSYPATARATCERIEELTGAPVSAIGVGPGRNETVTRELDLVVSG